MNTLVAALDCGTTALKAAVFDLYGRTRGIVSRPCPVVHRPGGRIEHDPRALMGAACAALRGALARSGAAPAQVAALSLCTQRATLVCADRHGQAIGRAISWQDLRGAGQIAALRRRIGDAAYYRITGLPNHPVFSLGKMLWVQHEASVTRKPARFALVHDYLLRELGCGDFFCDWSNASLTGLLDVAALRWSPEILALTGIKESQLPTLVPPGQPVGRLSREAARRTGLLAGTPLMAGGGDQQCAGLGAGAVAPGVVEITLGTAAVPLVYSERVARDPRRRVTCCAHAVPGRWEVEGLQNAAGASLEWLREVFDGPGRFGKEEFAAVARVRPGAGGILYYPYLTGSAAPHWDPQATGMLLGLRRDHDRAALVRAVMEGVSLETREILDVFASLKIPIREVRLTGGCTRIEVWNQMQADIFDKPVCTLETEEASLLGAAILAASGAGAFRSIAAAVKQMVRVKTVYRPRAANVAAYAGVYRRYREVHRDFQQRGTFAKIAAGKEDV